MSEAVVDAFVEDYPQLSRDVIRDVLRRTNVRAKLAVASLDVSLGLSPARSLCQRV
jgi:hypothetical protein